MPYRRFSAAIAVSLALLPAPRVLAQDGAGTSVEDIVRTFQHQEEASKNGAPPKTRSLIVAPGTDTGVDTGDTGDVAEMPVADGSYTIYDARDTVFVRVHFDFDSATLRDSEKPELTKICDAIKMVDMPLFRVVGHTDASGTADYNERLSLRRAEAVKRYLVTDCGIDEARLQAVGVGEAHLFDTDHPRAEANRRVEFQVAS